MKARLVAVLFAGALVSQAQSPTLEFEVASVKPAPFRPGGLEGGCHGIDTKYGPGQTAPPPLGRCVITDARLSHLIFIAYELDSMLQIRTNADWVATGDERFDVEAKAEDPAHATEVQLHTMLQKLMADRFQLKLHRQTEDKPGFGLVVEKGGPKFKESTAETTKASFGGKKEKGPGKPMPGRPVSMHVQRYSMAMLTTMLSAVAGKGAIVDKTGLTGFYDFSLAWDEDQGPALTTALHEQLGLKLESTKVPVSYLVVDSAQRPTGN